MKRKETKRNERHSYKRSNNEHPNIWKHMKNDHKKLEICGSIMLFFSMGGFLYIYMCEINEKTGDTEAKERKYPYSKQALYKMKVFNFYRVACVYVCVSLLPRYSLSMCVSGVYLRWNDCIRESLRIRSDKLVVRCSKSAWYTCTIYRKPSYEPQCTT